MSKIVVTHVNREGEKEKRRRGTKVKRICRQEKENDERETRSKSIRKCALIGRKGRRETVSE
jgi:hypothetical protein